jgi:hypothetical protein
LALAAADRDQRTLDRQAPQQHGDQQACRDLGFEGQAGDQGETPGGERALDRFQACQREVGLDPHTHLRQSRFDDRPGARAGLARDEGLSGELGRSDRAPARPRVAGGDHQDDLVAGHSLRLQSFEGIEPLDETDLRLPGADDRDDPGRVDHRHLRMKVRDGSPELGEPGRQEGLPDGVTRGDPQGLRSTADADRLLGGDQGVEGRRASG